MRPFLSILFRCLPTNSAMVAYAYI
ncbi:hypothetical protein MTBPR1_50176 [Candidatus Terasakiella magnetica]|uniref:Uncharacterized protein n=1 Tax=Candidatus Terasakiella magnetica TaxID=1867952 RepID=A0A1C3RJG1_9PROT|nr:hypothetical protein MTBPR1_50176 [Candidatus Terasakiella magnetica]